MVTGARALFCLQNRQPDEFGGDPSRWPHPDRFGTLTPPQSSSNIKIGVRSSALTVTVTGAEAGPGPLPLIPVTP